MFDIVIPMTWKSWSANEQNQDIWTLQNTYFYSMILVNVEVVTQRKKNCVYSCRYYKYILLMQIEW